MYTVNYGAKLYITKYILVLSDSLDQELFIYQHLKIDLKKRMAFSEPIIHKILCTIINFEEMM